MARKAQQKPEPKQPTLKQLQHKRTYLQESLAVRHLERTAKLIESFGWYDDWPMSGDLWERTRGRQTGRYLPPSQPGDRRGGANWPLWRTEQELDLLRQESRVLSKVNSFGGGLLKNVTNYVIGDGFSYNVQSKDRTDKRPNKPGVQNSRDIDLLVKTVQAWLDNHNLRNRWNCGADPFGNLPLANTREREAFRRVLRDGEAFLRLFFQENGETDIRFVEPELVRNPAGKTATRDGWSFGIQHHVDEDGCEDVERIIAYNIRYPNGEEEVVPAEEIVHIRDADEDCTVKRGTPAFSYDTKASLERASKLQRNVSIGAAIRAATAEVWEYETATQAQLTALASGAATTQVQNPMTGRLENIQEIKPGTILRVPQGSKRTNQDGESATPGHMTAVQGDLRQAATAFCAPEYMASADASNANYASTREAGTPFVLASEAGQNHFKSCFMAIQLRCLKHAAEKGRLPSNTLQVIDLQVEAPAIKQRDPLQKAQEDQILSPLGKSNQTILAEHGLDPDMEAANKQEWDDRFGPAAQGLPMPGDKPPVPGMMEGRDWLERAVGRLLLENDWDESKHKRAADGKFGSGGGSGGNSGGGSSAKDADRPADGDSAAKGIKGKAKAALAAVKNKLASFFGKLDSVTDVPGVKQVKDLVKGGLSKIGQAQKALYATMESRYGTKAAKAIFVAAQATGSNPAIFPMWFVALPGSTLLAQLPLMGVAEGVLQAARGVKAAGRGLKSLLSAAEESLTQAQIDALGKDLAEQLQQEFSDWLEENRDAVEKALGQLPDDLEESWEEDKHPRADDGKFGSGGGGSRGSSGGGSKDKDSPKGPATPTHGKIVGALSKMIDKANLPEGHKTQYKAAISDVVGRMPSTAAERLQANVKKARFYADAKALTDQLRAERPEVAKVLPPGKGIPGYYSGRDQGLNLDGAQGDQWTTAGLYAHEMAHAIDGPDQTWSKTPAWEQAWKEELGGDVLSRYASSKPVEGWAEFGRALYAGHVEAAELEKRFPKCSKIWKEAGLWVQ